MTTYMYNTCVLTDRDEIVFCPYSCSDNRALVSSVSSEGLMFYCRCFFFSCRHEISELPRPIAVKRCHMIAMCVYFIMQVKKFGGPSPQRKWGPKTCKIRRDFRQLQTSSANISGTGQDIQNRKEICSPSIPPAFHEERPVNFGPQTTENCVTKPLARLLEPLRIATILNIYLSNGM